MSIYTEDKSTEKYWATWKTVDFLPHIFGLVDQYFSKLDKHGISQLWEETYSAKNGTKIYEGHVSSKISFAGPNGEVVIVYANVYRNLLKHVLNTVTAQTPDTKPIAANNDHETKAQIAACKNVQEHFRAALNMPNKYRACVDYQLDHGMSYIVQFWDEDAKELRCEAATPRRVIIPLESNHSIDWAIWAERINKWEAIAKYNVKEEDYKHICNINTVYNGSVAGWYFDSDNDAYESDYIDIYHFWHKRCKALPQGRYSIFCNDHVSFTDHLNETLPFEHFPVHEFVPERITESPFGYTLGFDLLGIQKIINSTLSAIFTGQDKNKTIVAVPVGTSNPVPVDGDPQLSIIYYPASQSGPGVQSFTIFNIPEELFETLKIVQQLAQSLSGVNATSLGESSAKSGSHAALLFSVAQQFQTAVIDAYIDLIEDVDTARISLIKNNFPEEITLRISGNDKQVYLQEFHRDEISNITGIVRAQGVSPTLATPAGRLSVAETVMQIPPDSRGQYMNLLNTGQLDDTYANARDEDMVITEENEMLSQLENITYSEIEVTRFDGTKETIEVVNEVRALITDNHIRHMKRDDGPCHTALLSSPKVRNNPQLMKAVRTHAQEHIWLATYGSRQMLMASGQDPMPIDGARQLPQGQRVPLSAVPNTSEQSRTGQTPNPRDLPRQPMQPENPANPTVTGQANRPPTSAAIGR